MNELLIMIWILRGTIFRFSINKGRELGSLGTLVISVANPREHQVVCKLQPLDTRAVHR